MISEKQFSDKPEFNGEWVRLGDCFPYIKNGYSVKQDKAMGGLPITRIETLSGNRFNRDRVGYANIFTTDGIEDRVLKDGDILMSHINSIQYLGRSVMYQAKPNDCFIHGMNLLCLRADRETIDPAYATFYFQSQMFKRQIDKIAKKSVNQASFSTTSLKNIKIPAVSLARQREIAARLSAVSALVDACNNLLSALDDLVKSQFVEMFGDATSIASKWNQIPFGECLAVFESGNSPSCSNAPREGDNPAVLKLSALSSGRFIAGENKAMLEGEDINPGKEVKRGDILIARKNTPELVGSCAIVRDEVKNLMFPDIVFRVHPRDNVSGEYLCELLSGPSFSGKLKSLAHGSAKSMSNISKTALERLPVPLPPLSLQQQFADFVARVDKLGFDVQQQIEKLETLKQSLMQEYFG